MTTIRDYARDHHVSYEAIRKQIAKYQEDLDGHVITKGKTKYLDDFAVAFLDDRRREAPVSVIQWEETEVVRSLRDQIDALKNELMTSQKRVIELQSENQRMIAASTKYDLLVESSAGKDALIETLREDLSESRKSSDQLREELKDARAAEETAKKETDAAKLDADRARDDLKSARADADQIRKEADQAKERSEKLKKERDAAAKEAKSYRKSIFGFYRKIRE